MEQSHCLSLLEAIVGNQVSTISIKYGQGQASKVLIFKNDKLKNKSLS